MRALRNIVSEVYSPPRITKQLANSRNRWLVPGFSLDLTVRDPDNGKPWDFTSQAKREKARTMVREQKPILLIGSPMCTAFSQWCRFNRLRYKDPQKQHRLWVEACLHMDFVASLYREQLEGGRYFLHEHPRWASSWELDCIRSLMQVPGVQMAYADQCQYGAQARRGRDIGKPVRKPTGFLSNSPCIIEALSRRCTGRGGACSRKAGGEHAKCQGVITSEMAIYPKDLCKAVLKGMTRQMRMDRKLKPGCFGIQAVDDEDHVDDLIHSPENGFSGRYKDDISGQVLRDDLVKKARQDELQYFLAKGVWTKVPKAQARRETGKNAISVRWVDVNKGDDAEPRYRSRLVARQLKVHDHSGESYFAPAPPLEALRIIISLAITTCAHHRPDLNPTSPT